MRSAEVNPANCQEIYSGLVRIHILYHACQEPIFGLGMIEELAQAWVQVERGYSLPVAPRS